MLEKLLKPNHLKSRLHRALGKPVVVEFVSGGSRRIFIKPSEKGRLLVQLDPLIQLFDEDDLESLYDYLRDGDEESKASLIEALRRHARARVGATDGPLQQMLEDYQKRFFPALPTLRLVVGRIGKRSQQKTIRLASFWPNRKEVRIHPYMLEEEVPLMYLYYLLHHELCHAQLILSGQAKPGEHHGEDFRQLEAQYEHLEEACRWEREELPIVLQRHQRANAT